ncbi:hypothetical protein KQX54_009762 [Cotesia glomerata]|uniref:Uncharacterized protein n=1 Tax=Cotesia glomerata TaxID=32391 RepID=A0AAV7IMF7_COTGL|nr:hypothetical protein KQX54_009762 [Cotesia glomerata]
MEYEKTERKKNEWIVNVRATVRVGYAYVKELPLCKEGIASASAVGGGAEAGASGYNQRVLDPLAPQGMNGIVLMQTGESWPLAPRLNSESKVHHS